MEGFERRQILCNLGILQKYASANMKSKRIIKKFRPDVVIGTGGYASLPGNQNGSENGHSDVYTRAECVPGNFK